MTEKTVRAACAMLRALLENALLDNDQDTIEIAAAASMLIDDNGENALVALHDTDDRVKRTAALVMSPTERGTARRLRVGFSSREVDELADQVGDGVNVTLEARSYRALLDQARISAPLADGPEDTGAVLLVRVENLRVVDRRLIELAPDDLLVRAGDVAQVMRELAL